MYYKYMYYEKIFMNYLNIDHKIDRLNLKWQEYDFGDTLYAKIPIALLSGKTSINNNCETQKYRIEFQADGNAYIFQEMEQISFFTKIFALVSQINHALAREEKASEPDKQHADY